MKADRFPVIVHNRGKKMRKKTYTACSRMAAIFLAAVLMLTGCGTGAGESSSTGSKETQTTEADDTKTCLLYTSPSPRDVEEARMPSSA